MTGTIAVEMRRQEEIHGMEKGGLDKTAITEWLGSLEDAKQLIVG